MLENEIKQVVLRSGNSVSTGALASLGFWDIDVMFMTGRGRLVALLKSLDDDASVKTRLCQYEAYNGKKGIEIAKQIVLAKLRGQNLLLERYDLKPHDVEAFREKIEGIDSGIRLGVEAEYDTLEMPSIDEFSSYPEDWTTGYIENLKVAYLN